MAADARVISPPRTENDGWEGKGTCSEGSVINRVLFEELSFVGGATRSLNGLKLEDLNHLYLREKFNILVELLVFKAAPIISSPKPFLEAITFRRITGFYKNTILRVLCPNLKTSQKCFFFTKLFNWPI